MYIQGDDSLLTKRYEKIIKFENVVCSQRILNQIQKLRASVEKTNNYVFKLLILPWVTSNWTLCKFRQVIGGVKCFSGPQQIIVVWGLAPAAPPPPPPPPVPMPMLILVTVNELGQSLEDIKDNGLARTLKKLRTSKEDYWMEIKQWFSSIASLLKMGTSLNGKNLLPEGSNSFLYKQFLIVWKITLSYLVTSLERYYFYYARAYHA